MTQTINLEAYINAIKEKGIETSTSLKNSLVELRGFQLFYNQIDLFIEKSYLVNASSICSVRTSTCALAIRDIRDNGCENLTIDEKKINLVKEAYLEEFNFFKSHFSKIKFPDFYNSEITNSYEKEIMECVPSPHIFEFCPIKKIYKRKTLN